MQLYEALYPLLLPSQATTLSDELSTLFDSVFSTSYLSKMRRKLGLINDSQKDIEDSKLVEDFLELLERTGADFHAAFRALESLPVPPSNQVTSPSFIMNEASLILFFG